MRRPTRDSKVLSYDGKGREAIPADTLCRSRLRGRDFNAGLTQPSLDRRRSRPFPERSRRFETPPFLRSIHKSVLLWERREGAASLTANLRTSLTIFKIGFAVESASGFFALATNSSELPFHGYLILLSPVFSAFGILFLWVGRHEWNETHRTRVGHVNLAFLLSLVATALATAPIAYLTVSGGSDSTGWLGVEFGVAIALVFGVTFVTYALVAAHLVGRSGEVAMGLGLGWAVLVSGLIGAAVAPDLHPIVTAISARSTAIAAVTHPITLLDSLLAFSYLAFFFAFVDAHWRVAKGLTPEGAPMTPGVEPRLAQ